MPDNTVYVGRPTRWGNEFEVGDDVTPAQAVERFVVHVGSYFGWVEREIQRAFHPWPVQSTELRDWLKPLRGKNLACWCPLDQPCHADVLLAIANS
jgi:hypothetical protein